jgi:predicted RNA-binding protein with PUA-like domain
MAQRWLLKTEPSTYSFDQLEREGRTTWDGVRNPTALGHLRAIRTGDEILIYHTGAEKAVVGVAKALTGAYPDPTAGDPRLAVVDLAPVRRLHAPVPLARIKADAAFADFALVRISRLSVMPVSAPQWKRLLALSAG